ncbi:MAG: hypothetical protein M1812_003663 [Candelaria pacifica]|nr:MAG: hypothetical protein M1812_003663 [Candelaria pacifica]
MVKFYESSFSYDYSFPAVTLAYFLRYPNPLAHHVLSSDVIERHLDPETHRLHTTRLHLKRSKLPPAVLKLLPQSILGKTSNGSSQSYILEKSVIDVREGWMETETRNLEWTRILSVVERQVYRRQLSHTDLEIDSAASKSNVTDQTRDEKTEVTTTSRLHSRFGLKAKAKGGDSQPSGTSPEAEDEASAKKGFFSSWSTASLQRTIEIIGVRRTKEALLKSKDGMNIVLDRMRRGGVVGVLEGMRKDREAAFGPEGPWKRVWQGGQDTAKGDRPHQDQNTRFDDD